MYGVSETHTWQSRHVCATHVGLSGRKNAEFEKDKLCAIHLPLHSASRTTEISILSKPESASFWRVSLNGTESTPTA